MGFEICFLRQFIEGMWHIIICNSHHVNLIYQPSCHINYTKTMHIRITIFIVCGQLTTYKRNIIYTERRIIKKVTLHWSKAYLFNFDQVRLWSSLCFMGSEAVKTSVNSPKIDFASINWWNTTFCNICSLELWWIYWS